MPGRWVVGDIHGCVKTLKSLLEEKIKITHEDEIFFLGDYVDRGPASSRVLRYLMEMRLQGYKMRALKGNHEEMMLNALKNAAFRNAWFYNGGLNTLRSFGVEEVHDIPDQFIIFLHELEYYIELDDFILVHAGFNFEKGDPFEDKEAMLWIRNDEVFPEKLGGKKMVHGHTPIALEKIQADIQDENNFDIDLDNGCVYYGVEGLGHLCALDLNTMTLKTEKNLDIW